MRSEHMDRICLYTENVSIEQRYPQLTSAGFAQKCSLTIRGKADLRPSLSEAFIIVPKMGPGVLPP